MEHLDEQYPLMPLDDHLVHQTPDPMRIAATSDPRFYDRYWNVFHDDTGDLLIATGGTFYPNLDLAEAYAIVNYRGIQRSVRAFRPLGADRTDLHVGPIRPEIIEGLRRWQLVLEPNDWGISYDLEWTDKKRQIYTAAYGTFASTKPAGSQPQVNAGFEGFGEVTGWIDIDGVRIEWPRGTAHGSRDRHWGIGRGVGGPGMHPGRVVKAGWKGGNWIWFDDFAIWGRWVMYDYGDERPGVGEVVDVKRRVRFEEDTRIFTEAVIDYTFDTGETKQVHFERLGHQTAYMRCALYGGTPELGLHHGEYVGGPHVEGDKYDVRDPEVRSRLSGLNEHHCRITSGDVITTGILQPLEPDAYLACERGDKGWNFL